MIRGSCVCGGVRYEATGPLTLVARCHCVQCRKSSGAEFATNGSVAKEHFRITQGQDLLAEYESSPGNFRTFCKRCGSPLFKRDTNRPHMVRLRLGCLDEEISETPQFHVFVSEKPAWSEISDELPQHATRPGAG